MKNRFIILIFLLIVKIGNSQLQVFPATSQAQIAQLVQNILVGQGVTVSNITYTGALPAIGRFQTGATPTNIGFTTGLILASGNISTAVGPNSQTGAGTSLNTSGDALLTALSGYQSYDAAVLQFDFVPFSDSIKFQYIFASEEYNDYVNSGVNDVFGFFVSGLSPFGGFYTNKNIAIIPNTNTPVSINDVNNGNTGTWNSLPNGPCEYCQYYHTNINSYYATQYDGLTTILTAACKVIPCMTYHLKIAISDCGDGVFDSGVFLKANSFTSNYISFSQAPTLNIDTMAIEGCSDAVITFSIPAAKGTPTYVNFYAAGSATMGADYDSIPSTVIIPAGQTSTTLVVHPKMDNLNEPNEYITFIISTSPCTFDSMKVYIKNNNYFSPQMSNDTVLCTSGTANLNIIASGGQLPYHYLWSNGDTTQSSTVTPTITTTYTVTLTDVCNNDTTGSVVVKVSTPDYLVSGDTICPGETAHVTILQNGIVSYNWSNGANTQNIDVTPTITSNYYVTVTDTLGCTADTSAIVVVTPAPTITISNDTTSCSGSAVVLTVGGSDTYLWSTNDTTSSITVNPTSTKSYYVTATTLAGCVAEEDVSVFVIPYPTPSFFMPTDSICKGGTSSIKAEGAEHYYWSNGLSTNEILISPKESVTYTVTFSNELNGKKCQRTANVSLGVKDCNHFYFPNSFSPDGDGFNDFFGPVGVFEYIDFYEFYVYDRWGRLIFKSNDPTKSWDGTNGSGQQYSIGAYTYRLLIQETYGELYDLVGTVHLLR